MNSVLNPEAPEFYPDMTSLTQSYYLRVKKTIMSSKDLSTGSSYNLLKTFTNFNVVTSQLSENVIVESNQILTTELTGVKLNCNDDESNLEKIANANDSMIDRMNVNIINAIGVSEPNENFLYTANCGPSVSSWNKAPFIATVQVGTTTLITAKNILRPQLNFKDRVDNSESLWVPKISEKPNNIKPLALRILYNDNGEAVGYEHPYKAELDLYHPPSQFIDADLEPIPFPVPLLETTYTYIDTENQLDTLVEHLNGVNELAIDVEHHSYRTYQGITCLIQISTYEGGDFIIDVLAIREHIHKLNLAFTDPKKLKVFHGAENDVLWLQRDFGVYLVGLFDTHRAARMLHHSGLSLKHLLMRYCQVDIDKKYQLADWRIRPLPTELIEYARMDTHYLLYIWRLMRGELLVQAAGQPRLLLAVFEQSRQICGRTYNKEIITESSHIPLYMQSKKLFNSQQMAALKMLYKWRDAQARVLDESTTYLLPNHMLVSLAELLPREVQGVTACCHPMPPFIKQNLITIHRMLLSCRELPNEPQLYQMPTSIHSMVNVTMQPLSYNVHDFSHFSEFREDYIINLDQAACLLEDNHDFQPDIEVFTPVTNKKDYGSVVSDLNVDAKLFIPPYDRYRKYRSLVQIEEMKEFKEKEAKIAIIGRGNELIESEVLVKLQQVKTHIENSDKNDVQPSVSSKDNVVNAPKKMQQRKRKMSTEEVIMKSASTDNITDSKKKELTIDNCKKSENEKSLFYKNVDYKKFFNDTNKEHKQKQTKMKFKKYKK